MNMDMYPGKFAEPGLETYFIEIPIGASGAVGTAVRQRGFRDTTPAVRNSAGNYDLFLKEGVNEILHVSPYVETSAAGAVTAGAATVARCIGRTPSGSSPKVSILCTSALATPVATDPASGDTLIVKVVVKNTTA